MINLTNIKLTQNQQLIVNALLSMFASAFVGAAQAAYQYVTQHGTINIPQVLTVFIGALWVLLSTAFISYVPSHVQQELEALRELQMQVAAPAQPLVVIHATGASVQGSANSAPGVQIPPRPKPQQIALTNPTGASTVPVPMLQATAEVPQQVWLNTTMSGSSGVQQTATDDVLGDLPAATGASDVSQITGHIPVYGASGK